MSGDAHRDGPRPGSWADNAELALWDRELVGILGRRRRVVERWACQHGYTATPVDADALAARFRRLALELGTGDLGDALLTGVAQVLATDTLDTVVERLRSACSAETSGVDH